MSGLLDTVDQRTRLAGHNRLELLLFRLDGRQRFGINVFKVQEVIQCPRLTQVPKAHPVVRGIANMRGRTIPVLDLGMAIGKRPLADTGSCFVIITEFNRHVQGFAVNSVDRIINMLWNEILPPPPGASASSYMTAVTRVDGELVEIIDVEKILAEVIGQAIDVSDAVKDKSAEHGSAQYHVLVVDDSSVARKQVKRTLEQVGVTCTVANDGKQALSILQDWLAEGNPITNHISVVISDIEMPEMDGYTLTTEIRKNAKLKDLYVILHTSLSGVFNQSMVETVGANEFIPKFNADELADAVLDRIQALKS